MLDGVWNGAALAKRLGPRDSESSAQSSSGAVSTMFWNWFTACVLAWIGERREAGEYTGLSGGNPRDAGGFSG